jgi:hypothetical protein
VGFFNARVYEADYRRLVMDYRQLTQVLGAVIKKCGGEVRIGDSDLLDDYTVETFEDVKSMERVIRVLPGDTENE